MTTNTPEIGIVPCGGEFAVTNMETGEVLSYHLDRVAAEGAVASIPTATNRGLLPLQTFVPGCGTIVDRSDTAYCFETCGRSEWISFDRVHGKPGPVAPLLQFEIDGAEALAALRASGMPS